MGAPTLFLILSCCQNIDDDLERLAAKRFQVAAEKCLISVRDGGQKFDSSMDCKAAEKALDQFVDARDLTQESTLEVKAMVESGYRMAWAAKAKSVAADQNLKLWR